MDEVRELSRPPAGNGDAPHPEDPDRPARVCDHLGCPINKMRAVRLEMKYPPGLERGAAD